MQCTSALHVDLIKSLNTVEPLLKDTPKKNTSVLFAMPQICFLYRAEMRTSLYIEHFTRSQWCPQLRGSTVYRTLYQVPKVSTIEEFHCIRSTHDTHTKSNYVKVLCVSCTTRINKIHAKDKTMWCNPSTYIYAIWTNMHTICRAGNASWMGTVGERGDAFDFFLFFCASNLP